MSAATSLERYAVQPIVDGKPVSTSECIQVDAAGPLQAAELVLGIAVVPHGDPSQARAIVWSIASNFTPVSCTVYAAKS